MRKLTSALQLPRQCFHRRHIGRLHRSRPSRGALRAKPPPPAAHHTKPPPQRLPPPPTRVQTLPTAAPPAQPAPPHSAYPQLLAHRPPIPTVPRLCQNLTTTTDYRRQDPA